MSLSSITTFEQIGEYLESVKGLKYLDNPTTWLNAFKETVKDCRLVEVINDVTGETTQGWLSETWTSLGLNKTLTETSGVKNLPSVTNVVTDVTTGGAVAGAEAVALEPVGLTVTVTGWGMLAGALGGMGLGALWYEAAPEWWTDISNYVFGTDLSYEETEPFLRKGIKTMIAKASNGNTTTYIPSYISEKVYDFVKGHLVDAGGDIGYDFPSAIWNADGSIKSGAVQTVEYGDINEALFNKLITDSVTITIDKGLGNHSMPQASSIYQEFVQSCKNNDVRIGTDIDVVNVRFDAQYDVWDSGTYTFVIDCYKKSSNRVELRHRTKRINSDSIYDVEYQPFITTAMNRPIFSVRISSVQGVVTTEGRFNQTVADYGFHVNTHDISPTNRAYGDYNITNANSTLTDADAFDDYLKRNGVKKIGTNTPKKSSNFQSQYVDWYSDRIKISQPDKNGTPTQTDYIPAKVPIGSNNPTVDNIVNNGIGEDGFNKSQDDIQDGSLDPTINPIDSINDSIQDVINDYNNSDISPETTPNPSPQPLPDYPVTPPTDTDFDDTPDTPETPEAPAIIGGTASGMVSVYNPTKQEIRDFSGWLWSPNFLDNFLKIFQNPMDAIIGLHILYATPPTNGRDDIIVGYLNSGVQSKIVSKQYTEFDCGTVIVPEYYGNAVDYAPYTKVYCYLPFVGIVPIKTDDVMGKTVNIKYGVDVLTGTCLATITVTKNDKSIAMYTFTGNCAVQLPLSGGNYARVITSLVGIVGGAVVGGAVGAIGAVGSALGAKLDVQHSGSIGSNAGAMGIRNPYLIITRPSSYDADSYNDFYGFPSNKTVLLSSCKGYTRIKDVHVDNISVATENEKTMIENLLKNGVIIN